MKKVIINENQRGLLFKNGKYVKMLEAGKYFSCGGKEIEVLNLSQPIASDKCALDIILGDKMVADHVSVIEVADEELALHFVNGKFASILKQGKYAFWSQIDRHEFKIVDISTPEVSADVPAYPHFARFLLIDHNKPARNHCKYKHQVRQSAVLGSPACRRRNS